MERMDNGSEPFAAALRSAIAESGLSLERIRQRLDRLGTPVSTASLSHWQSGRSVPEKEQSLDAIAVLEEILGRPQGSLLELVGAPRPRGPSPTSLSDTTFLPRSGPVRRALDALDFRRPADFPHEVVVHVRLDVDADSDVQVIRFRLVVRGVTAGPCRVPMIHALYPEEPEDGPVITALDGCRVGRTVSLAEDRVYGAEIIVDAVTAAGEEAFLEYQLEVRAHHTRSTTCSYSVVRRCQAILVDARFRGVAAPRASVRFREDKQGNAVAPAPMDGTRRVHAAEHGFGPGRIGVRWAWDEEGELAG